MTTTLAHVLAAGRQLVLIAFMVMAAPFVIAAAHAQSSDFPLKSNNMSIVKNPTPQQAADIQSIKNVFTAFANYMDTYNFQGESSLYLPTSGFDMQSATATMQPSGCAPQPQANTPCIEGGGCTAKGYTSNVAFMQQYVREQPADQIIALGTRHNLGDMVVKIGDDKRSAVMWAYRSDGSIRYVIDFWKTLDGWKVKWFKLTYATPTTPCRVDWSRATNKLGILGTDLYLMQFATSGPQVPVAVENSPSIKRIDSYLDSILEQINSGADEKACASAKAMSSAMQGDAGLNTDRKEYFSALTGRLVDDLGCDGREPPDRSRSNGAWAASAIWRAYQLSGIANTPLAPWPNTVPAWSVDLIRRND